MGTTDDRGLTFEYHAEQDRRGSLAPERGKQASASIAFPGPNGGTSGVLPTSVDLNAGFVLAMTLRMNTDQPDLFSLISIGTIRSVSIAFNPTNGILFSVSDNVNFRGATLEQVILGRWVKKPIRFAFGYRPSDPLRYLALWANGRLIRTVDSQSTVAPLPWANSRNFNMSRDESVFTPIDRFRPQLTDNGAVPRIDYYRGSPSLVGEFGKPI